MNTIVNSNVTLGTQFIVVDINVIANSNVKLAYQLGDRREYTESI